MNNIIIIILVISLIILFIWDIFIRKPISPKYTPPNKDWASLSDSKIKEACHYDQRTKAWRCNLCNSLADECGCWDKNFLKNLKDTFNA